LQGKGMAQIGFTLTPSDSRRDLDDDQGGQDDRRATLS